MTGVEGTIGGATPARQARLGDRLVERGVITEAQLADALAYQKRTGERLGRIMLVLGMVRRRELAQALAEIWALPYVDLTETPPDPELARLLDVETCARERALPIGLVAGILEVAVAQQPGPELEALIRRQHAGPISWFATTEWDIDNGIAAVFRETIVAGSIYGLYERNPGECAFTVFTRSQYVALVVASVLLAGWFWLAPRGALLTLNVVLGLFFFAVMAFKLTVSLAGARRENFVTVTDDEVRALTEAELPVYSILVPAYREGAVIGDMLRNLKRLDYPPEKLDVLLLLEEDDTETIAAAKAARPPEFVRFLLIPKRNPRTKPKACNYGLFFARGDYLVIYDAEDRPEPDQLKKALLAFRKSPRRFGCVQAALNYFNWDDNLLARMFTLEYSFWFDYLLPGLDHLKLPIPLGGTSNHFPVSVLRELGGWDPFNVTEDADLGIRAAMHGYAVGIVNSTTFEEANIEPWNWIRQRSRWIKGYMQTALVFSRSPAQLLRQLGLRQTIGFLLTIWGTPVSFLLIPILTGTSVWWALTRSSALDAVFPPALLYLSLFNLLVGNMIAVYVNMLAVFKRRLYALILFAVFNPFYWILHSIASYKALWQLVTKPFYWEKTHHGLARQPA